MTALSPHDAPPPINMVFGQLLTNKITNPVLLDALISVPREKFVPKALAGAAYVDEDMEIVPGRYLLAPLTFAQLLNLAEITPVSRVLVVGDNGYAASVIRALGAEVVVAESDAALAASAKSVPGVTVQQVQNLAAGVPTTQLYDVIFVAGAIEQVPEALAGQLAMGGRLVAVKRVASRPGIGGGLGKGIVVKRIDGQVNVREYFDASAPLLPGFKHTDQFDF